MSFFLSKRFELLKAQFFLLFVTSMERITTTQTSHVKIKCDRNNINLRNVAELSKLVEQKKLYVRIDNQSVAMRTNQTNNKLQINNKFLKCNGQFNQRSFSWWPCLFIEKNDSKFKQIHGMHHNIIDLYMQVNSHTSRYFSIWTFVYWNGRLKFPNLKVILRIIT